MVFFRPLKFIFIVTEKHKNYHMKDEQLNKDGFKKFMKHEPCGFLSCKFSRTHNHIHCIRSNCDYVLHSSGQLFSHKRKHERKDNELAYRKYKLAQSMIPGQNGGGMPSFPGLAGPPSSPDNSNSMERPPSSSGSLTSGSSSPPLLPIAEPNGQVRHNPQMSMAQPLPPSSGYETKRETGSFMPIPQSLPDDVWQQYLLRFEQDEGCGFQECEVEDTEHFHCKDEGCETVFRNEEGVREHGRSHAQQDAITDQVFTKVDPEEPGSEEACPAACPYKGKEVHYHCKWVSCGFSISYLIIITCMHSVYPLQTVACFLIPIRQFKQWSENFPFNNKILRTVRAGWQFWDRGDSFAPRLGRGLKLSKHFLHCAEPENQPGIRQERTNQRTACSQLTHPCGLVKVRNVRNGNQCLGFITQRIHPNSNSSCV